MNRTDVIVVGAGLGGLSAARDLVAGGADVVVLEARHRAGGRVEQTFMSDGRPIQLGGEVIGDAHTSYRQLVAELGLTIVPSFAGKPGESTWLFNDGRVVGEEESWMPAADLEIYEELEEKFAALSATVDPDNPWAHPDAVALDRMSVGEWLRSEGATPLIMRMMEMGALAVGEPGNERRSFLSDLRTEATAGSNGFYDYAAWENSKVLEGSATVPLRMAAELGHRIRYDSAVRAIDVGSFGAVVTLFTGQQLAAADVVVAVPAGPLRDLRITGLSKEYLESVTWRQHSIAAKFVPVYESSFWDKNGQNGTGFFENTLLGGTWEQTEGALSALVPVDRIGPYLALPHAQREAALLEELVAAYGPEARETQAVFIRDWFADRWTQGYSATWRPGDVMKVGPLHGKHEPPFWLVGSGQWVSDYMEGAIRTGRAAARQMLER